MSTFALRRFAVTLSGLLAVVLFTPAARAGGPVPVSPGERDRIAPASAACPTFSWTTAEAAEGYELAVYEVRGGDPEALSPKPALRASLPAGATSWTPPGDRCLTPGRRYAWSVRASGAATRPWSESALFELPSNEAGPALSAGPATAASATVTAAERAAAPIAPRIAAEPRLRVSGDLVATGDYAFATPRTVRVSVPAEDFSLFRSDEDDVWWVSSGGGFAFINGGTAPRDVPLRTGVALPDGATITGFRCFYYDDWGAGESTGNLHLIAELARRHRSETFAVPLASVSAFSSGASTELFVVADDSVDSPLVDNAEYDYRVAAQVEADSVSQHLRFYGCEIELEVDRLAAR